MSQTWNGPAPSPNGTGPETQAATKPPILAVDCRASGDNSAPLTEADLSQLFRDEKLRDTFENADQHTKSCWSTAIDYLAVSGTPFCADTCRELGVPEPSHPNHVGAFFMAAAKAGVIRPVGFVQSTRRQRHAAWMRQWVGGAAR